MTTLLIILTAPLRLLIGLIAAIVATIVAISQVAFSPGEFQFRDLAGLMYLVWGDVFRWTFGIQRNLFS